MTREPRVTVVVLTHQRAAEVLTTLARLAALPERPRVIVVDNASTDGTAAMVATVFPHVRLLQAEANLGSSGRTFGAAMATRPYVAFCDDDASWLPGSLARAVAVLDAHPHVAAITGSVVVGLDRRPDPLSTLMAASPLTAGARALPGPAIIGMMATATMVRRQPFLDAGGFHPRYGIGGEEALLALDLRAAGWEVCYVPAVVVHHRPLPTGRAPAARRRTMVRNDLWTAWLRYPAGPALAATAGLLGRSVREHGPAVAAGALLAAARGWRWVRSERCALPAATMDDVRRVRRQQADDRTADGPTR
jgi:GT2 family glycosyltransferase